MSVVPAADELYKMNYVKMNATSDLIKFTEVKNRISCQRLLL